jgi:hypothetical protein
VRCAFRSCVPDCRRAANSCTLRSKDLPPQFATAVCHRSLPPPLPSLSPSLATTAAAGTVAAIYVVEGLTASSVGRTANAFWHYQLPVIRMR